MILASDNSESMSIWMSVVLSDLRYNLKKQLIICQAFYSEEKKKKPGKKKMTKTPRYYTLKATNDYISFRHLYKWLFH